MLSDVLFRRCGFVGRGGRKSGLYGVYMNGFRLLYEINKMTCKLQNLIWHVLEVDIACIADDDGFLEKQKKYLQN